MAVAAQHLPITVVWVLPWTVRFSVHLCNGPPASWFRGALNHSSNDPSIQNQVLYATSSLFRDVIQSRLVTGYRHFGTTYRSHLQRSGSPETSVTVILLCVTSQKEEYLFFLSLHRVFWYMYSSLTNKRTFINLKNTLKFTLKYT
jgi:hypothetical protein